MSEAKWYVVHTYSGYENKVKANIDKTIENRHLEDQILEVRVPMQDVVELKNGVQKATQKKMFPCAVCVTYRICSTSLFPCAPDESSYPLSCCSYAAYILYIPM